MSESTTNISANAADALDAISREGFRRKPFFRRIVLRIGILPLAVIVIAAITIVVAGVSYLVSARRDGEPVAPPRAVVPVAILLPGALDEQGELQLLASAGPPQVVGFERAWNQSVGLVNTSTFPNKKYYEFPLPTLGSPDWDAISPTLDELFEELYGEGIRYFIVTMSDTVLKLTADHPMRGESVWEKFSKRHEIDPPILIATVASAPLPAGAVVSNGVIRNYIRSLDEVNQFVAYMASRNKADPEVFLLYINDDYGTEARDLIKRKLEQDQQAIKKMIPIELSGNDFDAIFRELDDEIDDAENRYTFVILVGYGDMVVGMLDVLNREEQSYQTSGISRVEEVLAASTLTEKAWQPTFYRDTRGQFLPRISTVKPFGENADCEGSVVCQFSHMTLSIVLECDDTRGIEEFFSCFEGQTRTSGFPDIELSTKGDSIVPLRIAVTEGIGVSVSEPSD